MISGFLRILSLVTNQLHMDNIQEIWKEIPNSGGIYLISSQGNVLNTSTNHQLAINFDRYPQVSIRLNGVSKSVRIHRMLAMLFIPNPENKPEVNHKNGNKHDFSIGNLEWCSRSENKIHAYKTGLHIPNHGSLNGHARLSINDVERIRQEYSSGDYGTLKALGSKFGISESHTHEIVKHKKWKVLL
jgi:hypothetical protein